MQNRYGCSQVGGARRQALDPDSPAEYLRCRIDVTAGDYSVAADVQVTEFAGHWLMVDIRPIGETNRAASLRFLEFTDDLDHAFRTFYECSSQSRQGLARTWRVRHIRDCPWM